MVKTLKVVALVLVTVVVLIVLPLAAGDLEVQASLPLELSGERASDVQADTRSDASVELQPVADPQPTAVWGARYPRPGGEGSQDYDFATGCCVDGNSSCTDNC